MTSQASLSLSLSLSLSQKSLTHNIGSASALPIISVVGLCLYLWQSCSRAILNCCGGLVACMDWGRLFQSNAVWKKKLCMWALSWEKGPVAQPAGLRETSNENLLSAVNLNVWPPTKKNDTSWEWGFFFEAVVLHFIQDKLLFAKNAKKSFLIENTQGPFSRLTAHYIGWCCTTTLAKKNWDNRTHVAQARDLSSIHSFHSFIHSYIYLGRIARKAKVDAYQSHAPDWITREKKKEEREKRRDKKEKIKKILNVHVEF